MDEFEQAPGDGEEQGSLAFCSPGGGKETKLNDSTATTKGQGYRTSPCVRDADASEQRTNSKQVKHMFMSELEVNSV